MEKLKSKHKNDFMVKPMEKCSRREKHSPHDRR